MHEHLIGKWNGAHSPHASCVKTRITFSNPFVVFSHRQYAVASMAVGQNENRAFDPFEEFLYDHRGRRRPEHARKHCFEFLLRFFKRIDDKHSLAGSQPVGF